MLASCGKGGVCLPEETDVIFEEEKVWVYFDGCDKQTLVIGYEEKSFVLKANTRKFWLNWSDLDYIEFKQEESQGILIINSNRGTKTKIGRISKDTYDKIKKAVGDGIEFR